MRKVSFVLGLVALFACVSGASAAVVLSDNFDSYDQASFEAAYPRVYPATTMSLFEGFDSDLNGGSGMGNSVDGHGASYTTRNYRNFARTTGTDAAPLEFSFDMYLDPAAQGRNFCEIRSNAGSGYNDGALLGLVALGVYYSVTPTTNYAVRSLYDNGAGSNSGPSWMATDIAIMEGWHTLKAVIGDTQIKFYVDDTLATVANGTFAATGFNSIVIGAGLSSTVDGFFDNVLIQTTPEPATLLMLAAGGLFLRRRRTA